MPDCATSRNLNLRSGERLESAGRQFDVDGHSPERAKRQRHEGADVTFRMLLRVSLYPALAGGLHAGATATLLGNRGDQQPQNY
jgi:hypothetical protein